MKAFFHIGMDKTGTTFLQGFAHEKRAELLKHGICYPLGVWPNDFSHVDFARAHGAGWHFEATELESERAEQLLMGLDPTKALLVSSEALSVVPNAAFVNRLKRWTLCYGYDDCKIILYLRNQIDMFVSLYGESIKWGRKENLDEFYKISRDRLFFSEMIKSWELYFGAENLIVMNYDEEKEKLLLSFLRCIGLSEFAEFEDYQPVFDNVSPPQIVLEYIRRNRLPLGRAQLYEYITSTFGRRREAKLRDLAKLAVWRLPEALIEDIQKFELDNSLIKNSRFKPFKSLNQVVAEYNAKVMDLDEEDITRNFLLFSLDLLYQR